MPLLSTDRDSREHPFSTEHFSGGPLIMTIVEEQFVHKVSFSSLVPKAPTPAASNQLGTGWHWEAGLEAKRTTTVHRGAQGSARKSLWHVEDRRSPKICHQSLHQGRGSWGEVAAQKTQKPSQRGLRPSRRGGQEFRAREGGDGILPHLHVVWGPVNLLNHGSQCQRAAHNARPLTGLKCRSARFK